jgi:assimilatory nitrate reductase catalytic subunit
MDSELFSLQAKTGPLSRDLLLEPSKFGLGKLPFKSTPDFATRMVCGYCSIGCGLIGHLKNGQAVGLSPATEYPVNMGMACPKGWEALEVLQAPDRAKTPLLRNKISGILEPCTWHDALTSFSERFKGIQNKYGNDAVAFLSTGQIVTEEMAFLGALAKFGMGILDGDGNTRQCMATSAVAYKQSFGFDAPPYSYSDLELSDVVFLIGSNMAIAHPILWERVLRNPNNPKILVVDPRKTETAMAATSHLPILPKSDLVFLYCLAQVLIENDWVDSEYIASATHGYEEFAAFVKPFTPESQSHLIGLTPEVIREVVKIIHEGKSVSFWWTMGVNQSHEGTRTAQAIINLALMTGNMGRPGTGANSITGQCNAMGSRLFSNTTNLLGGHDFLNEGHRQKIADLLGMDLSRIPTRNSLSYHEIIQQIEKGKIKGLWIIATNPAHSWIEKNALFRAFQGLDFLVVQDMYHSTETAQMADLVLPAAGWGEKDGTFINSERRIGLVKKIAKAPGHALSDFSIFNLIANYWGCADLFKEWKDPESVFQILKKISVGQPCDFSGIKDYLMLEEQMGIQWPFSQADATLGPPSVARRLFEDGRYYHADGKARFIFENPRAPLEIPDLDFPFWLLTGRGAASQWHTQTRTGKSQVLNKLSPKSIYAEINYQDAKDLGIAPGTKVRVTTRRGSLVANTSISHSIQKGQVYLPMHYVETNCLTLAQFDPYSKQPSYKACAVKLEPVRPE